MDAAERWGSYSLAFTKKDADYFRCHETQKATLKSFWSKCAAEQRNGAEWEAGGLIRVDYGMYEDWQRSTL